MAEGRSVGNRDEGKAGLQKELREDSVVAESKKTRSRRLAANMLLVAAIVVMFCVAAGLIVSTPRYWGWCLTRLDIRNWTYWSWVGAGAAALFMLLAFRMWPESKGRSSEPVPSAFDAGEPAVVEDREEMRRTA